MRGRDRQNGPRLVAGPGAELVDAAGHRILRGRSRGEWEHPWTVEAVYETLEDGSGEWRAYITPGFVNGRDVWVSMPGGWNGTEGTDATDVALTDEPEPYLVLGGWRNPLLPQGVSASADGRILAGKPEGYPPGLEAYGVKVPARGGDVAQPGALETQSDEDRDRELRAVDIVLTKPRQGTRLEVRTGDAMVDAQTQFIDTVFTNDLVRSTRGRPKLQVMAKYVPLSRDQTTAMMYGTLINSGDAQMDQLLIATVWMVSPPGAGPDDVPDQTWEPVPQYFVYWNVNHATRVVMPSTPQPPLRLDLGLAGGVTDALNNAMLSLINDQNAEVMAFLGQADSRGMFWSV